MNDLRKISLNSQKRLRSETEGRPNNWS